MLCLPTLIQVGVAGALSAFEPHASDIADPASRLRSCMRLISRMPTLAAIAFRTSAGYPIIYPRVRTHAPCRDACCEAAGWSPPGP